MARCSVMARRTSGSASMTLGDDQLSPQKGGELEQLKKDFASTADICVALVGRLRKQNRSTAEQLRLHRTQPYRIETIVVKEHSRGLTMSRPNGPPAEHATPHLAAHSGHLSFAQSSHSSNRAATGWSASDRRAASSRRSKSRPERTENSVRPRLFLLPCKRKHLRRFTQTMKKSAA